MRRTHWWGVAAAAGLLLGAATVAPAALATGGGSRPDRPRTDAVKYIAQSKVQPARATSTEPATYGARPAPPPGTKPGATPGKRRHGCNYPAGAVPSVALSAPGRPLVGQVVTLNAKVTLNKCGQSDAAVALWASTNGKNWKQIHVTTTGKDGAATFSYLARHQALMRLVVASANGMAPGQSDVYRLEPRSAKK